MNSSSKLPSATQLHLLFSCSDTCFYFGSVRQFLMLPPLVLSSLLGIPMADFEERIVNLTMVYQTDQFQGIWWGYDEDIPGYHQQSRANPNGHPTISKWTLWHFFEYTGRKPYLRDPIKWLPTCWLPVCFASWLPFLYNGGPQDS